MAAHVPPSGSLGGMVRYTVELARALAARDDVDLHVLTTPEVFEFFGQLVDRNRLWRAPVLPTLLRSVIERSGVGLPAFNARIDVLHGTKHLLPRRSTAHRLLTVHDMLPIDRPRDFSASKRLLIRRPYLESIREADSLICVSDATRDRLRSVAPGAANKATVVPLATSSDLMQTPAVPVTTLRARHFALVVGDSSPRKNLSTIIDCWPDVIAIVPRAVLVLVGPPGWGVNSYGRAYDALRASGALLHLPPLSVAELRWCYENAVIVLCPSVLEGFGLPAREAMDLGAAVITSDDPALCEVTGTAALHLPSTDRLAWASAIAAAFGGRRARPARVAVRTWMDVATETVEAVSRAS